MEDAGYETARLRGVDVFATAVTMLRQRGLSVVEICERPLPSPLPPLPARAPTDTEHGTSEAAVLACLGPSIRPRTEAELARGHDGQPARGPDGQPARGPEGQPVRAAPAAPAAPSAPAATTIQPVVRARFSSALPPPEGTSAAVHALRGEAGPGDETWVFTLQQPKITVKALRTVREAADTLLEAIPEASRPPRVSVVVLSRNKISQVSTVEFAGTPYRLERFLFSELTYNLTSHFLVPPHRLCSPEEVAVLKRRFPKLALQARDDPVSRFHGLLPGDVILYNRTRAGVLGGPYWREVM
jgi:DNA-directed RNA polymerase subunit H (RpoH/RPB5)